MVCFCFLVLFKKFTASTVYVLSLDHPNYPKLYYSQNKQHKKNAAFHFHICFAKLCAAFSCSDGKGFAK